MNTLLATSLYNLLLFLPSASGERVGRDGSRHCGAATSSAHSTSPRATVAVLALGIGLVFESDSAAE
jgi:hypothetical protein